MDGALPGGNMNAVVREGSTVLRDAGPWTPTVHRYLAHLRSAGLDWVPAPLGVEGGRERLSFVEGDVPVYPLPAWVWRDAVLVESGRRLRLLHDASTGLSLEGAVWQQPARTPAEVVCHNDFAPHNLAFAEGAIVGAIDFDMCSPGPRIHDLASFATRAVPLTAEPPDGAPPLSDARRRVALLLDAYGSDAVWDALLAAAVRQLLELARFTLGKARDLGRPDLVAHAAQYERDAAFLSAHPF